MNKVRFQGGITKLVASKIGEKNKSKFSKFINNNLSFLAKDVSGMHIDIEVVSFSSCRDFEEQVLSILTFIKNIGIPSCWTLYSDGTHTAEQISISENAFGFLKIIQNNTYHNSLPGEIKDTLIVHKKYLLDYANKSPLGKKLLYYLNFSIKKPTIFLDSDVLFYQKASCIRNILEENVDGWFLPDAEWGNLDSRYIARTNPQHYQINSGLFFLKREIKSISVGLDFLKCMSGNYEYFSEQSVFHIILSNNNLFPLDPRVFVLNSDDQFDFSYLYSRENIAARHYTSPVRHKMWQRDWKWHLSL
ncbi:MAG: hypothetical protein EOO61_00925 [Hymenobacter sp.]|nr:MAG: hypothetical protein EOO61_00925 [Hymenobacter sp.]